MTKQSPLPPTEALPQLPPAASQGDCGSRLALAEGIQAISLCETIEDLMHVMLNRAEAIYPCLNWLYGEIPDPANPEEVEIRAFTHTPFKAIFTGMRVPILKSTFSHRLYEEKRLSYVGEDTGTLGELNPSFVETFALTSFLGMPLVFGGKVVGALFAATFKGESPKAPSDAQVCALQNLALVSAMALHRMRIQTALKEQIARVSRLNERLSTLQASLSEVAVQSDLNKVLRTLLELVQESTGIEKWGVYRVNETASHLNLLATLGLPRDAPMPPPIPIEGPDSGVSGRAVKDGRTVIAPDLAADPFSKVYKPLLEPLGIRSAFAIPLRNREGIVLGALTGFSAGVGTPAEEVLSQAEAFSILTTLALERFQIWEQLHQELAQRKESEVLYKTLVDESLAGVYLIQDDHFTYANPAMREMFGYTEAELSNKTVEDLVAPSDRELVLNNIRRRVSGEVQDVHYNFNALRGDGTIFPVEVHGSRVDIKGKPAVLGMIMDITETRRAHSQNEELQRQLFQSQKMESLGVLAGGIAHDFNNLLMGILGYAGLAVDHVDPASPAIAHLQAIESAVHRATGLTRQLLDYAGKGQFQEEYLDLNLHVEGMAHLLEVTISKVVALRFDLASGLPLVKGDPAQVQQVVMNLIINAAESIEAKGETGGVIHLRTSLQNLDEGQARKLLEGAGLTGGPYLLLEVSDTGAGMDADTLAHIFEPFFTTKFTGRGLGLSAILGIVRGHHGGLSIHSELGVGTTFHVYFPAAGRTSGSGLQAPEPPLPNVVSPESKDALILVVDDEDTVRAVAEECLRLGGFRVLGARGGFKALDILHLHGEAIALVLLDMTMPEMSGEATFREIRARWPRVRVLFSSGFPESNLPAAIRGPGMVGFIQKPYTSRQLQEKVRAALRGEA